MRRIAVFVALAMAVSAMSANARDLRIAAGHWSIDIPRTLESVPGAPGLSYKEELDGPFHTLAFRVVFQTSLKWEEASRRVRRPGDVFGLHYLLTDVLVDRKREWGKSGGRIASASVAAMENDLLPPHSICDGFKWSADDVGVPTLRGAVSVMHGYSVICIDFLEGAAEFDIIEIALSERYCAKLGHTPLQDFKARARNILGSVRYTNGPPHDTLGGVPASPEASPFALSGVVPTPEGPIEAGPKQQTCSG
jgi:hypothetical protein